MLAAANSQLISNVAGRKTKFLQDRLLLVSVQCLEERRPTRTTRSSFVAPKRRSCFPEALSDGEPFFAAPKPYRREAFRRIPST